MRQTVIDRLASIGYTRTVADDWLLDFAIRKTEDTIRNRCNVSAVPAGLFEVAVDMAAGEFLLTKKAAGQLTGLDLDAPVKSVTEGDTSVTFAIGDASLTPEQRLDALIARMLGGHGDELMKYRRLVW